MNIKVKQLYSYKNHPVLGWFIVTTESEDGTEKCESLQSPDSTVAEKRLENYEESIILDINLWNKTRAIARYRNIFLGIRSKEIHEKINNGDILLEDLNNEYKKEI
jgi:hypothetical protein